MKNKEHIDALINLRTAMEAYLKYVSIARRNKHQSITDTIICDMVRSWNVLLLGAIDGLQRRNKR